jgi:hypothetical protein
MTALARPVAKYRSLEPLKAPWPCMQGRLLGARNDARDRAVFGSSTFGIYGQLCKRSMGADE